MSKRDTPQSGPIGNQDNSKRGRDIPPGGRVTKPGTKSDKTPDLPDGVEGYGIGGRGKK